MSKGFNVKFKILYIIFFRLPGLQRGNIFIVIWNFEIKQFILTNHSFSVELLMNLVSIF